jgi:hypothetical protein
MNLGTWDNLIIVWQGSSDIYILQQLNITNPILNLRVWDIYGDNNFFIQLLNNKLVIAECPIGHYKKNGRSLSLQEAHNLVCKLKHEEHDPCTDVIWTRCIFNPPLSTYPEKHIRGT